MSQKTTYLDNNATTRVDPRVVAALVPLLAERYGNPSSAHVFGAQVAVQVEEARRQVAQLIGARDSEIVFTSGGTEADNAALRGVLAARPGKRHVVISTVEHHAIFEPCERFEREGVQVTRVGVDGQGPEGSGAVFSSVAFRVPRPSIRRIKKILPTRPIRRNEFFTPPI